MHLGLTDPQVRKQEAQQAILAGYLSVQHHFFLIERAAMRNSVLALDHDLASPDGVRMHCACSCVCLLV